MRQNREKWNLFEAPEDSIVDGRCVDLFSGSVGAFNVNNPHPYTPSSRSYSLLRRMSRLAKKTRGDFMPSCEDKEGVYGQGNGAIRNKTSEIINQWQGTPLSTSLFLLVWLQSSMRKPKHALRFSAHTGRKHKQANTNASLMRTQADCADGELKDGVMAKKKKVLLKPRCDDPEAVGLALQAPDIAVPQALPRPS